MEGRSRFTGQPYKEGTPPIRREPTLQQQLNRLYNNSDQSPEQIEQQQTQRALQEHMRGLEKNPTFDEQVVFFYEPKEKDIAAKNDHWD